MAFILIVFIEFKNKFDKDLFIQKFKEYQKYCLQEEADFLYQFEYAVSDKQLNKITIIEKFKNKYCYVNIHCESKEFKKFKQETKNIDKIITGESFLS